MSVSWHDTVFVSRHHSIAANCNIGPLRGVGSESGGLEVRRVWAPKCSVHTKPGLHDRCCGTHLYLQIWQRLLTNTSYLCHRARWSLFTFNPDCLISEGVLWQPSCEKDCAWTQRPTSSHRIAPGQDKLRFSGYIGYLYYLFQNLQHLDTSCIILHSAGSLARSGHSCTLRFKGPSQ